MTDPMFDPVWGPPSKDGQPAPSLCWSRAHVEALAKSTHDTATRLFGDVITLVFAGPDGQLQTTHHAVDWSKLTTDVASSRTPTKTLDVTKKN